MDTPKQTKAVIYCRVSTKEQVEEGNSLATQEKNCRDYAFKNGYEIVATFIEQGESAKTVDRTELKKLIAYCSKKKNEVSVVIAYKIDRISRNTDDYSHIRILLRQYNVEIKSTSEHFENTPAGRFMENIIANVAQFDNDVRAERCAGGMRDAVREGRYVWMAPYGYSNVRINGKATIAPNQFGPFVHRAFEEVAKQQYPVREIYKKLVAEGMHTPSGNPLSQSQFYAMLRNELYTGWISKFRERHKGLYEHLISQELFNTVQNVLAGKKPGYPLRNNENPDFPLRRFFRHPSGKVMTGCWSKGRKKKYPYYVIQSCNINIRKELLESIFKGWLNQFKLDVNYFEKIKKLVHIHNGNGIEDLKNHEEESKTKIESLKAKQVLILNKNLEGIISNELCKEQISSIDTEIYSLTQKLKSLPVESIDYDYLLELLRDVLLRPAEVWEQADILHKIQLQWFYFPHGIEFDGKSNRTTKICSLFKAKKPFRYSFSYNVHYPNKKSNTDNWQVLKIEENNTDKQSNPSLEDVKEELMQLQAILCHDSNSETLSNVT